jgi:hypothetical protein
MADYEAERSGSGIGPRKLVVVANVHPNSEVALENRWKTGLVLAAMLGLGMLLSYGIDDNKGAMQAFAIGLSLVSVGLVVKRAMAGIETLLSCYTMVMLAPVWFLYAEAMLPNGDCWLLPANEVIRALCSCLFFLLVFHLSHRVRTPQIIARFHERYFNAVVPATLLPLVAVGLTSVTFVVVLARYEWDWAFVKSVYLAGRVGGSGLIRRGGIGGWEVFLQPLDFMCSTVPTIAALSWVQFSNERKVGLLIRSAASACAIFLVFVMFLGGSRGFLAVYIAGPAVIWLTFGSRIGLRLFFITTIPMFLLLIGIWELQQRKRNNILEGIGSISEFAAQTTFDPTKSHRDNNLYLLTLHHMYMPEPYQYNGFGELVYLLCNPIPRALWPGKPKGIQQDEDTFRTATGPPTMGPIPMGTASLSFSIVGDGYRMLHLFGVGAWAIIFGIAASFWDLMPRKNILGARLYFILNCAWCFWFLWGFRAGFAFVTGMYPVWGAYLLCFVGGIFGKYPNACSLSASVPKRTGGVRGRSTYADHLHRSEP